MANRSALIESLEGRQLLHSAFSASINFQQLTSQRAPGLLADYGATYDVRRGGLSYGWNKDMTKYAVERNVTKVQKNDTFMVVPTGSKWEIGVENGDYRVYIVAGDPRLFNERQGINVEGETAVSGITRKAKPFIEGAINVEVTDGKLTVEGAPWVEMNKLAYLSVQSVEASPSAKTLSVAATFPNTSETSGAAAGLFTITRTGDLSKALTVGVSMGGTAANTTDYGRFGPAATFAAGVSKIELPVRAMADGLTEGTETVTLTLGNVTGYTIDSRAAIVSIADSAVPSTNSFWSKGANAPTNIGEVAGGIVNGKMYMIGGANQNTYEYTIATNTWRSSLAKRPYWGDHFAAETYNGKIYFIGGQGGSAGRVQIYNPSTNSWSNGAAMPYTAGSVSSSLIGGKIYIAGGIIGTSSSNYTGTSTTNKTAVYNIATNTWTNLANMPVGRNHAAAATDGSLFYVFGGRDGANKTTNGFNDVQIYNPGTNTWVWSKTGGSGIPNLPQARGGMGKAVFYGGEFYVIGGETQSAGATSKKVYQRVDIYNPVSKSWRLGPNMPTARHGIFPLLNGSKIYVAMGGDAAAGGDTNVLEVLNLV